MNDEVLEGLIVHLPLEKRAIHLLTGKSLPVMVLISLAFNFTQLAAPAFFRAPMKRFFTAGSLWRAVWGKGQTGVLEQIHHIEQLLPFALRGFDCDNGSEFLNHHLLRHFTERRQPIQFTRSRAYHKDDNAHVEQKNWTHVRQWLGYERFAAPSIVTLLNGLYTQEWRLFHNFFCPSMKLIAKERVGSKTLKRHDSPKTPYQRIMESPHIGETVKKALPTQVKTLNPFVLREAMESKLKEIFNACYTYDHFSQRSLSSVG